MSGDGGTRGITGRESWEHGGTRSVTGNGGAPAEFGARGYRGRRWRGGGLWEWGSTGVPGAGGLVGVERGGKRDVSRAGVGWSSGSEHGSNRDVTGAEGLGAPSPGMEGSEYGGNGGVTGHRGISGSGGLHTQRYQGVTGHGGLEAWGLWTNGVPAGLGRLRTWSYQVCHQYSGHGDNTGAAGSWCGGGGDVTGTGGARGLEVPGAFLRLEEVRNGILSRTLGLGVVTRAGGNWGTEIMGASPGFIMRLTLGLGRLRTCRQWGANGAGDLGPYRGQWGGSRLGFHPPDDPGASSLAASIPEHLQALPCGGVEALCQGGGCGRPHGNGGTSTMGRGGTGQGWAVLTHPPSFPGFQRTQG